MEYTLENCTVDVDIPANMTPWEFLEDLRLREALGHVLPKDKLTSYQNFYDSFADQKYTLRDDQLPEYYHALSALKSTTGTVYFFCYNCKCVSLTIKRCYYHERTNCISLYKILSKRQFKNDKEIIKHMKKQLTAVKEYDVENNVTVIWPLHAKKTGGCNNGYPQKGRRAYHRPKDQLSAPEFMLDSSDNDELCSKRSLSTYLDTACS